MRITLEREIDPGQSEMQRHPGYVGQRVAVADHPSVPRKRVVDFGEQAQQRRLVLAQLRYKTGVDSYLTLLVAQNDLNNAQLARVSASLGRLINLVALYQDLGGGWLEHLGDRAPVDSPP